MGNPVARLRFKTATSFAMFVLASIAFIRLLGVVPLTMASAMPFFVATVLAAAGLWRGLIYWQAMRVLPKP